MQYISIKTLKEYVLHEVVFYGDVCQTYHVTVVFAIAEPGYEADTSYHVKTYTDLKTRTG